MVLGPILGLIWIALWVGILGNGARQIDWKNREN